MKGADRVTVNAPRVLYLVISGAPAPEGLPSLVTLAQESGWRVVVFSTPMGARFADLDELERLTGQPVRWEYRMPGTGERTPPADAVLACPLTFNIGLTVGAVGVDLEQAGDAVLGAAGDLGRGHPEFSHSDTAACRRS
jgi:hypothetical protein